MVNEKSLLTSARVRVAKAKANGIMKKMYSNAQDNLKQFLCKKTIFRAMSVARCSTILIYIVCVCVRARVSRICIVHNVQFAQEK